MDKDRLQQLAGIENKKTDEIPNKLLNEDIDEERQWNDWVARLTAIADEIYESNMAYHESDDEARIATAEHLDSLYDQVRKDYE